MSITHSVPSQFPAILWYENAGGPTVFGTFPGQWSRPTQNGYIAVSQPVILTVACGFAMDLLEGKYQM